MRCRVDGTARRLTRAAAAILLLNVRLNTRDVWHMCIMGHGGPPADALVLTGRLTSGVTETFLLFWSLLWTGLPWNWLRLPRQDTAAPPRLEQPLL